MRHFNVQRHMH